ncbi:glycoside hydrolase family 97 protein [uncultured Draconibacterium sp.]|uniref:glycoside hydrolase family 97 protein n=1 Tax=uncultured Draconibacterium sp. TaxID=1573823 RepID=UPI0025F5EDD1|nr:glycoside hydrolase family 97 protein [uncultured Draconibacterium sp.]
MKIQNLIIALVFIGLFNSCLKTKTYILESPNGEIQLSLSNIDNSCGLTLKKNKYTIIDSSYLGLQVNKLDFSKNVSIEGFSKSTVDETWETVNGKQQTVRNYYNEYKVQVVSQNIIQASYEIIFRLYNDGFAYRYNFPEHCFKDSILIDKELTHLNINGDFTYWAYNREYHNLGPANRAEEVNEEVLIPMVMKLGDNGYMAIHEAEIIEFGPLSINAAAADNSLGFNIDYSARDKGFKTSWRTFILGDKVGDLVESNMLTNLNEPCKIEDTSWIKPGKSLWDWRVWGYQAEDGYTYKLDTKTHKRFIDFAAENNIQYLLIDADWYGEEFNEKSDPTTARKDIDIEECMRYASKKGVGVILYLNDVGAKQFGLERVLRQFSDWGASGVKYGFMTGTPEEKVLHTRKVVELCAKYRLTVNFHDNPIAPSGDRRMYPNLLTKEYGHAQADAKRSYYPETAVNQPLINMIAGPLDLTNCWFDLNSAHSRVKVFQEIPGTVSAEVAKLITIYTGMMILPDSPEEYLKKDDLFDCIRKMPAQFDSFKVLDAELDKYVSIARKAGDDWFIGSLTNRDQRNLEVDLSFLPENQKFEAVIYSDTKDTHFLENKEAYQIETMEVENGTKLNIYLAPGGGCAVYLKKL